MKPHWNILQTILAIATLASTACCQQPHVLDLSTVGWTVTSPNYTNINVPGRLPSQVHLDLYAAKVIENPLWGLNDFNLRWIGDSNWTYTSAPLTGISRNASQTYLLFNGLDTFTSIQFCGYHVAATNNQFRQYWFDVSDLLRNCSSRGGPMIKIDFGSATVIANATAELPGQETWPPGVEGWFEFPNRQFIRKEQNDFGWDWGPAFAPAGPWQPAYVIQLGAEDVYARNTLVDTYREGQLPLMIPDQSKNWVLNASIDYLGSLPLDAILNFRISDGSGRTVLSGPLNNVTSGIGVITGSSVIPKELVELWWPVGMGPQTLYNLTIDVVGGGNRSVLSVEKRIGFRTIVLNEWPVTEAQLAQGIAPGNNWHFEINGHEFYAKGSNFIPPDPFWPTVTKERIRQLFESVVDGNQNMLRIWSSGAYSPDFMYDLADEMGILLWSEFEFGDALYPVDKGFLQNVAEEVNYQTRRINHHPSLAFWAGGNELENLELSLVPWGSRDRYTAEYESLFLDTIVPVLFGNSRSVSYSPSSTSNGWLELDFTKVQPITERYHNLTSGSIYGNTDHYNYDSLSSFNTSSYPIGRFANEFGYHSMPSLQTWLQAVSPSDLSFDNPTVILRNHHYPQGSLAQNLDNPSRGMEEMEDAARLWYPVPNKTDKVANFSAWCHTTQIFQADYYKSQIQFYRRGSGLPERNLGSLYWQLEDQWQAPTWAGIEYDGRWKVLHYVAKDIYESVVVVPWFEVQSGDLEVWVVSDLWKGVEAKVQLGWFDWSGRPLNVSTGAGTKMENVNVGAINATRVLATNTNTLLSSAGIDPRDALLRMRVSATGSPPNSNVERKFEHENWFHASPLSESRLIDPGLEISHNNSTQKFVVKATKGVAAWVWLDYPSGAVVTFDANAFWLAPGEAKEVGYKVKSDTTGETWMKGVSGRSLWDNTVP
ncbi:putative beta-mannosidase [Delitschia confertaspora ATCC 74209]|uniref:Beta-mannosidase A n=1 Tax=Delitschia confertaspora ATCC 74209 TaxID=1513339 RepID=A0A9P4MZ29_9PLEO|nr:putative beta-mannosidase [Delitschia confertaspora ATCC 74209]